MSSMNSIRATFFEECEELLEALSEGLSLMQDGDQDPETVNAVFRAVHSIKGGAGAFALNDLVAFTHRFETLLDCLRAGKIELTAEVMHIILRSADHLADQVEAARGEREIDEAVTAGFLAQLDQCLGEDAPPPPGSADDEDFDFGFAAVPLDFAPLGADNGDEPFAPAPEALDNGADSNTLLGGTKAGLWKIAFHPQPALYTNGHDPVLILAALAELGTIKVTPDLSQHPTWDEDASAQIAQAWMGWTIELSTHESETSIREIFEFVDGLCALTIEPVAKDILSLESPSTAIEDSVSNPSAQVLGQPPLEQISAIVQTPPSAPIPEVAPPPLAVAAPAPGRPLAPRKDARSGDDDVGPGGPKPTLRVDLERVDRLINAVGELIINQAMIEQSILDMNLASDAEVITHVEDYRLLARDLQEAVMAIRAQPVKPLFQRMSRIVREAAEATGKAARMVTIGESTEVDKTVIERLADPLTHMIRNSVDHGLESREARIAAGKDPEGTIRLSAAHRSGSVLITIKDDGAGLNRTRIREKAIANGLIPADADLTDTEIDNLIFLPGFSTADKISNLSGRGVGLDVVKNAVTALGGRVAILSTPGEGTEFSISLPLTLAVMDGMVISVSGQTMVIPIASVIETIRPSPSELHLLGTNEHVLAMRGQFLPMIDVAQCLGFPERDASQQPLLLLVETEHQTQCALIVDAVHDQRQVVIKGLESNYGAIPGVSAATVLGDGQIALILDTEALTANRLSTAHDSNRHQAHPAPALTGQPHIGEQHAIH